MIRAQTHRKPGVQDWSAFVFFFPCFVKQHRKLQHYPPLVSREADTRLETVEQRMLFVYILLVLFKACQFAVSVQFAQLLLHILGRTLCTAKRLQSFSCRYMCL